jgi:hypothetical protein
VTLEALEVTGEAIEDPTSWANQFENMMSDKKAVETDTMESLRAAVPCKVLGLTEWQMLEEEQDEV